VKEAENGAVGTQLFRKEPADLVVTDMQMPVQGGVETIIQIKREFPRAPIIGMTGGGLQSNFRALLSDGKSKVDAWLSKPFRPDEFLTVVESVLTSNRKHVVR
jgi:CheY-like chemotaxis protein